MLLHPQHDSSFFTFNHSLLSYDNSEGHKYRTATEQTKLTTDQEKRLFKNTLKMAKFNSTSVSNPQIIRNKLNSFQYYRELLNSDYAFSNLISKSHNFVSTNNTLSSSTIYPPSLTPSAGWCYSNINM